MTTVVLIRHGQASFGSADYDQLSPLGHAQATRLGQRWRDAGAVPAAPWVVAGTQRRHLQTAQTCLAELGEVGRAAAQALHTDAGFNEYDHEAVLRAHRPDLPDDAALQNHLRAQAARGENPRRVFQQLLSLAMAAWLAGAHPPEALEPWAAFQQRCREALARAVAQAQAVQAPAVWVFSSGGPISVLASAALGLPDAQALELAWMLRNASLTRLLAGRSRWRLESFNDTAHLEHATEPSLLTYR